MNLYRIRDWNMHFENNRTRELKRLDWVPVPNKHDGDGFTELLDHPNGMAHYGAWHLLLQVASKCTPRGTLARDIGTIPQEGAGIPQEGAGCCQTPHDAHSLARITHGSESVFEQAIPRLLSIGWIEICGASRHNPAGGCGKVPMEGKGMEGNGTVTHTHPALSDVKAVAGMRGITDAVAERFWHHYESSGWIDKNGHPIVKWESKLMTWASDERAKPLEKAHHASASPAADSIRNQEELKRVERKLEEIANQSIRDAWGAKFTDAQKAERAKLLNRKVELMKALGFQA